MVDRIKLKKKEVNLDDLVEALKKATVDNQILGRDLSRMIGFYEKPKAQNRKMRLALRHLTKLGYPIGSTSKGYFLVNDEADLIKYLNHLDTDIRGYRERKRLIKKAFKHWMEKGGKV